MTRKVAPWWAHGYLCPHCGGPLRWLGEWRGADFRRKPMEVLLTERVSADDVPERVVVGRSGVEAKTELRFRHKLSLECIPCCKLLSEDQARRATLPDERYPRSYFVEGDQPPLGSASAAQTGRAGDGRP